MIRPNRLGLTILAQLCLAAHPTLAKAPDPPARGPSVWVVIIGIERYGDPAIPSCGRSISESYELRQWFLEKAEWDRSHLLMMNANGEKEHGRPEEPIGNLVPTQANLEWATTEWIGHRAREGDTVVLYFAGQATLIGGDLVLLPIDARSQQLARSGWSPEQAIDTLARVRGCTVVCWLDTSPQGRGRTVTAAPGDTSAAADADRLLDRLTRWPGVTVWLAATERASAEGSMRSPFAAALQSGLGNRPGNVMACLHRVVEDPALAAQGFRSRGGLRPELSLWPPHRMPAHKARREPIPQHGHADAVTAVATTADGARTITASRDSTIRIWRTRDRALLGVLAWHTIGVTAVDLAPDGQSIASGDGEGRVRVWDLADRRPRPFTGPSPHLSRITRLAFLPSGTWLVSLDQDGHCAFWHLDDPELQPRRLTRSNYVLLAAAAREGPAAVALADSEGVLYLLDVKGRPLRELNEPGARPTTLQMAPDGTRVALGDDQGRVSVWDVTSGALIYRRDHNARISALAFDSAGRLAVAAGGGFFLVDPGGKPADLMRADTSGEVIDARFSVDGRWVAALTQDAELHLWGLSAEGRFVLRELPLERPSSGFTALALTPDGKALIAGEAHGAIRSWDLPDRRERPRIPPHRGKVDVLDLSTDGRYLLQINHEGTALVWDLRERAVRVLDGRWASGSFVPRTGDLVLTRDPDEEEGGSVVLLDRASGRLLRTYAPPPGGDGGPAPTDFERVAVAPNGRQLVAAAAPGRAELACVWAVDGGDPRTIRGPGRAPSALDISSTGLLLTAGEDGAVRVWDLTAPVPQRDPSRPVAVLPAVGDQEIAAARFGPDDPRRILLARWAAGQPSRVTLATWAPGEPPRERPLGELQGRVQALTLTADGRWAAAAGQDRRLRIWDLAADPPRDVEIEPDHPERHHSEQVNALVAAPVGGRPVIVSGGDDTTIRFWGVDADSPRATLLGTLTADVAARPRAVPDVVKPRPLPPKVDWVAYTPDGVYDASPDGESLVRFSYGWEDRSLDQDAERFYHVHLAEDLRHGIQPPAPPQTQPPPLGIEVTANRDDRRRDVELRIALPGPGAGATSGRLRLYHDGEPIEGLEARPVDATGRLAVSVRLLPGRNRFYAMAERPGDVDARSPDLEVFYDGPAPPGRLHILALGVSAYLRNSLQFADRDARAMADFLHEHGKPGVGAPGLKIVLTDNAVTEKTVEDAFATIRHAVQGQPQDTVVVFLAGHTAVLSDPSGRDRFSLLLPPFPFPADAPLLTDNRGLRLVAAGQPRPSGIDLPFYAIYRHLTQLEALHRLVIVDACQAEAILDDPGVRLVQEIMEKDAHRGRTSYILATRRGEPAGESEVLEHGLLTYALLRGMKAPGLRPLTARVPALEELSSADEDGDGVVTTWELYDYTDRVLPELAAVYPRLAQRSGGAPLVPLPASGQALRVQAAAASFPLIELPPDQAGAEHRSAPASPSVTAAPAGAR